MSEAFELAIPLAARHLGVVRGFFATLASECASIRLTPREVAEVQLVLQEACINAIRHSGARGRATGVRVRFLLDDDRLTIEIHDRGPGFDPDAVPVPDADALQEGGYGVFIMRETMDRLETRREGDRFVVSLTKFYRRETRPVGASGP